MGLVSGYVDMGRKRLGLTKAEIAQLPCARPGCTKKLGSGRVDRRYCSESCRMKNREMERVRFMRSELLEKLCQDCQKVLGLEIFSGMGP